MKALSVKHKWFGESDLRLDASYHLSDGPLTKMKLKNSPYEETTLANECERIFSGNIFKRSYVESEEFGYPYLTGSDMVKTDINSKKYISKKYTTQADNLRIKKDWILISCSGTLGNCVFTNEDFEGRVGTHDLIRAIPSEKNIKRGYLYAYLSSRYGYGLLTQSSYGGVVKHIEPHHIEDLPIPILPEPKQQEIHNLIEEASNLRVEANKLLREVNNKIESQFIFEKRKTRFSINIQDILKGDKYTKEARLESDYYQPSVQNLIKQIQKSDWVYLGDVTFEIHRSGLRERSFVEKGIPLVTGQNLNMARLQGLKMLSRKFTRNIEKNITKEGDVLVSVQGTIGKIEYVFKNMYQGVFASEQLSKIKVDSSKIHPGYVACFLRSKLGELQLLRHKTGSVIEWVKENNIASVVIPMPEDKGKEIGNIYNQATSKLEEAFEIENKAIELVENEFESWQKS